MRKLITAVFAFALCFGVSANAVAQTQNAKTEGHGYDQGRQMTERLNMQSEMQAREGIVYVTPLIHEYIYEDMTEVKIPARHERRLGSMYTYYYNEADSAYSNFKKGLKENYGFSYGLDWSITAQRGAPNGHKTALQNIYYPYAQLDLFNTHSLLGSAQVNFNYTLVRYWGLSSLSDNLGVATPVNDYPGRQNLFSQLTFNHTWGGALSWLSWAIGQYPLYNFDGTTYNSNQQTGLINYAMSQNASATYPQASFGAYAEITPTEELTFAGGYQDATNVTGSVMRVNTAFDGKYTGFGSVTYTPTNVFGLGKGQYSGLVYYQPSVEKQLGHSMGWSLNMEQNLCNNLVMFGRANGSTNSVSPIKNSYMLGMSYVNPLNRNPLDTITVGVAYNRIAKDVYAPAYVRTGETVFEAQWVWGLGSYFTITPDLQMYNRAAFKADSGWVSVFTLRATLMI